MFNHQALNSSSCRSIDEDYVYRLYARGPATKFENDIPKCAFSDTKGDVKVLVPIDPLGNGQEEKGQL